MNRLLVTLLDNQAVVLPITNARPPDALAGVSIAHWKTNGQFSPPLAALFIDGDAAMTIDSPTGGANGAELWGFRDNVWRICGYLNNGAPVLIAGAGLGFAQEINVVGIFDRLYVCGTESGGSATARLVPMPQWSTP